MNNMLKKVHAGDDSSSEDGEDQSFHTSDEEKPKLTKQEKKEEKKVLRAKLNVTFDSAPIIDNKIEKKDKKDK
jgi:hypothetical protein